MGELDKKTELLTTPILPVTLAELGGLNALPTPRTVAEIVNESGKLELAGHRLRVHLRIRTARELDATRVLYAAEELVVAAIKSPGKSKEIISLPDKPVLAGGAIASGAAQVGRSSTSWPGRN
jgi:hypothetical protein